MMWKMLIPSSTDDGNSNQPNFEPNESSFGHELVAGGAAFAGFKAFEDHQRSEGTFYIPVLCHSTCSNKLTHPLFSPGKPVSHQFAKELLAGFAGAEVDKLAETKGEDWFDKEKAKRQAKENAMQVGPSTAHHIRMQIYFVY